ncbi:MAG: acyltransferase [Spirosomataceae bacterium]
MYKSKIEVIQVIRGIAAISVVFYHCKTKLTSDDSLKELLDWLFNSGAAGVDIFFVLSGFVMVYSIESYVVEKEISSIDFLVRRIIRIWPAYLFFTLLYLIIQHCLGEVKNEINYKLVVKSVLFLPTASSDPPHYGYPTLSVGWSLNYEIYFYCIFALSLLWKKYRYHFFFLFFITFLYLFPEMMKNTFSIKPDAGNYFENTYLNFLTNPICWEFAAGVLIGVLYVNKYASQIIKKYTPKWVAYAIVVLVIWHFISGFRGGHGITGWGFSAILLMFAAVFCFDTEKYPQRLLFLGEISYSLYLVHLPVQLFLTRIFELNGLPMLRQGQSMLFLTVVTSLLIAYLSHELLEKQLYDLIVKKLKQRSVI